MCFLQYQIGARRCSFFYVRTLPLSFPQSPLIARFTSISLTSSIYSFSVTLNRHPRFSLHYHCYILRIFNLFLVEFRPVSRRVSTRSSQSFTSFLYEKIYENITHSYSVPYKDTKMSSIFNIRNRVYPFIYNLRSSEKLTNSPFHCR